ncbi:hypothetical protein [uncultured Psychrobacillus sp.]|uniref:hypothetical protein n=1 Tax=uncultured Psychrobacillus sp. TaxID=1551585 RepID=UPI00263887D6|nr:hypothetical protein [uncultured Psychrobacillus sp.]
MEPSKEFDELFEEMKHVERSNEARRNTWLAIKERTEQKKRRTFPAVLALAAIAIASYFLITNMIPAETEQTAQSLTNEEVIMAVIEKEYNGPDMEFNRLSEEWLNLQSKTVEENPEEYDMLLVSKEYKDLMNYYYSSFDKYFTENLLETALNINMVFKYNHQLIDSNIDMQLERVQIKQDKDHPTIYRTEVEVSLTNSKGQKIFHTLKEEYIFSKTEPGKIGRYNLMLAPDGNHLYDIIPNFDAYFNNRKPSIDVSFDSICFNGRTGSKQINGCTTDTVQINEIMDSINDLPIQEVTEDESNWRAELISQVDSFQIYLTNEADQGMTLYTVTLYDDGKLVYAPGMDMGITGDITISSHQDVYKKVTKMLTTFAETD